MVLVGVVIVVGFHEGVIEVGLAVVVGIKLGSGLATPELGAGVKFSGVNGGSALGAVDTWPFE